jgi:putative nucleotidyltransferase with HDIG domain
MPLPDQVRRLIASGDFVVCEHDALKSWLASDPDLAVRLLRWCNTPLFNLSTPYNSVEDAAKIMKGQQIAQLAVLACVRNFFIPEKEIDIYSRERLWGHSMAVAAVGSLIARTCSVANPDLVFMAGALHDIGMLASERIDQASFQEVLLETDELSPSYEVEQDFLGWDHTQLGEALLQHWGMPEAICMSARYHHAAETCLEHPHSKVVSCVAIANHLCSRVGWSSVGKHAVASPPPTVFADLGIDSDLLTVLWQRLYSSLESGARLR